MFSLIPIKQLAHPRICEASVTDPRTAVSKGWFVEGEGFAAEGGKGEETPTDSRANRVSLRREKGRPLREKEN